MSYGEIDNNEALYDGTPNLSQHLANTEQFKIDAGTSEDVLDILKSKWRENL